jgi:hypothetical protein
VSWAVGVAEVSDALTGAACFDGGFPGWIPDDQDVPDLVGSEVGVPEDQVAWFPLAGLDACAVTGGKPGALRGGGAGHLDADLGIAGLGEAGAVPGGWPWARPARVAVSPQPRSPLMSMKRQQLAAIRFRATGYVGLARTPSRVGLPLAPQPEGLLRCRFPAGRDGQVGAYGRATRQSRRPDRRECGSRCAAGRLGLGSQRTNAAVPFGRGFWSPIGRHVHPLGDLRRRGGRSVQAVRTIVGDERWPSAAGATARLPVRLETRVSPPSKVVASRGFVLPRCA